jgi:D-threonate/D-erythronate kinase
VGALAMDTETRALPPADAYRRVRDIAARLRALAPEHVYKKVDSTLRGNLGAEIDAVMDALDLQLAVVAPAYPFMHRTTRDGIHRLRGTPVHETEIGRDPKTPVRESNLVRLLESASRRIPALVSFDVVERGAAAIRDAVVALVRRGVSLVVCDAESDRALHSIVEAFADRHDVLWVGSAGLAEHLADLVSLPRRPTRAPELEASDGPVLLVAGSASETTRRQVAALATHRNTTLVRLQPSDLIGSDAELDRWCAGLRTTLAAGGDCALTIDPASVRVENADALVDALGRLAADAACGCPLRGLILTGGDTARSVCHHLGVSGIHLLAEVQPGVPLGRLVGNSAVQLLAVTKAGAFGSERTLLDALDRLKLDRLKGEM